jgi:uncharacterized protein (TIGR03790 family)
MAGGFNVLRTALALLICFLSRPSFSQETGDSVVLVYNRKSAASKEVAEHYAARRKVPADQIIALSLPETESISRDDFESKLQKPLWTAMRSRKLLVYRPRDPQQVTQLCNVVESKVRYAVLCYGVPVKISPDPGRKEEASEKVQPELRRNEAAVDSELALLPMLDHKLAITGMLGNPAYGTTNTHWLNPTNGILMVARLDGPTQQLAMGLVDKALQGEADGLWGRAYFDQRGLNDGPYKIGDEWIQGASEVARVYGFETVIDKAANTFPPQTPLSDIALYFGWYDQSVSGPFTNGMAQFRPGAVAYHLHSFSARVLRVNDVWWAGPLIALGATATMGCTEEPYLQTTPEPHLFLSRFVLLGFSFGEAAYACQRALSWQNTVVGDPLYRPFRKTQQERFAQLEATISKDLEWSILMYIDFRLAQGAPFEEIEKFYEQNAECKKSAVLQEKLGDLYRSHGKLFEAADPYAKALALPMNPLQKLRVSLSAASVFTVAGKDEEAYSLLKGVLQAHPNYADKKSIYERLQTMAERLHKDDEATEFERLAKQS